MILQFLYVPYWLFAFLFAYSFTLLAGTCTSLKDFVESAGDPSNLYVRNAGGEWKEAWGVDGSDATNPYSSYDRSFKSIFPEPAVTFRELVKLRSHERRLHVLDLYGSAFFLSPSEVATLTGMRLGPFKRIFPVGFPAENWREVTGNIYSRSTWINLDKHMLTKEIGAFQLITVRPIAGVHWHQKNAIRAFLNVLGRGYERLDAEGGEMFVEFGSTLALPLEKNWPKEIPGVKIEIRSLRGGGFVLYLRRQSSSPKRIASYLQPIQNSDE